MTQQLESKRPAPASEEHHSRVRDLASRLYSGEAGIDIIGRRKIAYLVAGVILLIAIVTLLVRGSDINLGIEFRGGNSFTVPQSVGTMEEVRSAVQDAGGNVATAQAVGGGGEPTYLIKTEEVTASEAAQIVAALADRFGIPESSVGQSAVSGAWGASITRKAVTGSLVFLVLVMIYLSAVFREWRMAVAALASLLLNLVLTVAVYLLLDFEVTPSTVIGFLTILGFALYDVVVVFDKVRENTRAITANPNRTYGEAANLAVNQTMMRSINTGVVALLPVGGLLFIGAGLLGAGTLKDIGLVLFVGMFAAVCSSIFFAAPVLVDLKEAEPKYKLHKQRVLARRAVAGKVTAAGRVLGGRARAGAAAPDQATPAAAKAGGSAAKAGGSAAKPNSSAAKPGRDAGADADSGALAAAAIPRPGARPAPRKGRGSGRPGGKGGSRSGRRR